MGLADRNYHPASGGRSPYSLVGSPVVKWLLIYNIGVFIVELVAAGSGNTSTDYLFTKRYGMFSVQDAFHHGEIWRIITCQFLHKDGQHLFANMLGLFFFGRYVEQWWGSLKFLGFYFICGVAGPLLFTLLIYLPGFFPYSDVSRYMLGASAGVYGVMIAVALIAPNLRVLLFFFLPMSIRVLAFLMLGYSCLAVVFGLPNAGGEAAHLGGALLGFILMKKPQLLSWLGGGADRKRKQQRKKTIDRHRARESKMKPRIEIDLNDTKVDAILDKVNREGIQSLTEKEKKILKKAAE
ncbi:MAG: rhomboid family intramembrane serine protease [Akkermansiaceae bacterium]